MLLIVLAGIDTFIGPSASLHCQAGASLQNQVSISDFLIFLEKLEFVASLWKFLEKQLWNFLSEIVTLEYTLMRCIHWAVRFSLDRRASLQNQVTISDFLISSVNMEFVVC